MFRRLITIAAGGTLGVAALATVTIRVGALFGAGERLDAYLVGVSGPSLLLSLVGAVVTSALTPKLSVLPPHLAARRAGEWALLAFLMATVLAAAILLARTWLITALAPGLPTHSASLAADVIAIYSLSLPATLAATVYSAYGFANGRVWTSGASAALYAFVWLVLLFTDAFTTSVVMVSVACVIASQVQFVSAFLTSAPKHLRPWPGWRLPASALATLAAVSGIGLSVALGKANLLLDPMLGSLADEGDISLLVYGTRLAIVIVALCGQGPALAVLSGRRSTTEGGNPLAPAGFGCAVLIACGFATAVAIVFEPAARLVLAHGKFTPAAAEQVGRIVEAYAPAIVLMIVAWSLEATLYSMGFVWRVALLNVPALVVNVCLSLVLLPPLGVMARPLAVGASMALYVVSLGVYLRRLDGGFDVLAAIPRRATARLVALVTAVSVASHFGGNAVVHAPILWAVIALLLAAALSILAARSWLGDRELATGQPADKQRLDVAVPAP